MRFTPSDDMPQHNPRPRNPSRKSAEPLEQIPRTGYLRQGQILGSIVPISATTLWRWVRLGKFPRPIKLSSKVTAWRAADIRTWMEAH